jgi:hypothetical protein
MKQSNLQNYANEKNVSIEGGYDASEYANLPVSSEVK